MGFDHRPSPVRLRPWPTSPLGWLRLALLPLLLLGLLYVVSIAMPGTSFRGEPPPATDAERATAARLRASVEHLSGTIGERHDGRADALAAAADWLEAELADLGDTVRRRPVRWAEREAFNLEVVRPGDPGAPSIVVGGHYDTARGTPGADDNASGAAGVLELARLLRGRRFRHTLRLVLFTNEEPPHFQRASMGSRVYARDLARDGVEVRAMYSLETIGYFRRAEGTQHYPFPFGLFYPTRGDFVAFVGHLGSRDLVRRSVAAFRASVPFPSEAVAAPSFIPGIGWSDHWSFWQEGWPAVMVTDTAPFRNPRYHEAEDVADALDFDAMARIVHGMLAILEEIDADRSP